MKKQIRVLRTLLLSALAFVAVEGAWADNHEKKKGRKGGGKFMQCFKEKFEPTEEQLSKIRGIMREQREKRKARKKGEHQEKMKAAVAELETALKSKASTREVKRKFEAIQEMREEKQEERFENLLAIREVLTAEQRKKIGECGGPLSIRMGGRHGKRGGRKGGSDEG